MRFCCRKVFFRRLDIAISFGKLFFFFIIIIILPLFPIYC